MQTDLICELEQLKEFQHGSIEAFEAIFRSHQRAVYRWILRIIRNPAAAEDVTIETFWRIRRAHARFDPSRGFEPWARRIVTHAALDWLKSQRPENAMPAEYFAELPSLPIADPCISAEIRRKTAQAFMRLPPKLRLAATLAVVEERPYKEIADALAISLVAVKVRVFRALRILRKDLERQGIKP
jgi:RNA polymerase sigma-70 factor (ECF subfamily)